VLGLVRRAIRQFNLFDLDDGRFDVHGVPHFDGSLIVMDDSGSHRNRPRQSYLQPDDLVRGRKDEVVAALWDADAETRQAALQALLRIITSLQSKPVDDMTVTQAEHCGGLLRDLGTIDQRELQIEGLLQVSRLLFGSTSAARAATYAEPALEWARQLGRPQLHWQAANLNGVYALKQRDFATSLALFDEAYQVAIQHGLEAARLRVLSNLGACLQDAGYYARAVDINRQLLAAAQRDGAAGEREAAVLGNLVHCHLVMGQLGQAVNAGESAAKIFDSGAGGSNAVARYQFENFYASALLEAGRAGEALQRSRALRAQPLATSKHTEVLSALTQGLCEVFAGQADIGMSRLEGLLPAAEAAGWYVDDVLRALIRANEKAGDLRRALEYVDKLAASFEGTRTRELHAQLARIQQEVLGELDPQAHAEILLGEQAAVLRVQSFNALVAERARTLLENWAVAASLIDDETGRHCFRVGRLSFLMAQRLGLGHQQAAAIETAGRLHDIGKIGISHQILLKPSMLTPAERIIIQRHPVVGAEMISRWAHSHAPMAAIVAATHHEWWDGSGYPKGLRGEQISLEARIVSIVDVYDVLTSPRPYKRAWPHQTAVDEIRFMGGRQFDPQLVDIFVELVNDYVATYGEAGDEAYRAALEDSPVLRQHKKIRLLVDA